MQEMNHIKGFIFWPASLIDPDKKRDVPVVTILTPEFHAVRNGPYRYISCGNEPKLAT